MEVHPPEHGIHTWRDFFVHMATICLGLLIAIGLEQSVEWVHHQHQRRELVENLRIEGERNVQIIATDQVLFDAMRKWELQLRSNVNAMRASDGKANLPYIPLLLHGQPTVPSNTTWTTAKESFVAQYLPPAEAGMYSRLDLQHQLLQGSIDRWLVVKTDLTAFERNFDDAALSSYPDLAAMNSDDLRAYAVLLNKDIAGRDEIQFRLNNFLVLDQAMLDGAKSEDEMLKKASAVRLR